MAEYSDIDATGAGNIETVAGSFLLDRALPFLGHAVILPFRWIFMTALPAIFSGTFTVLRMILGYLWSILCALSTPILFPLRVLFVWPALWTLHFIYQVRHLLYFVCGATILGCILGLASTYVLTRPSKQAMAYRKRSNSELSDGEGYNYVSVAKDKPAPSMRGALYNEKKGEDYSTGVKSTETERKSLRISDEDRFSQTMAALADARRRRAQGASA